MVGRIGADHAGTVLTVSSVQTGTIATGQTVIDPSVNNLVQAGTVIQSGASLSWVVNGSQNVGASFTGNSTGTTTLTVSGIAAGNTIVIGHFLTGGGTIPAGTFITAFGTGTGGNGTYITNNATTITAGANQTNLSLVSVAPAVGSVQANINQQPVLNALDVAVTVS